MEHKAVKEVSVVVMRATGLRLVQVMSSGAGSSTAAAFFTKNGEFLGVAFTEVPTGLYPTVGLNAGNAVEGNFGQKAFNYDIKRVRQLC